MKSLDEDILVSIANETLHNFYHKGEAIFDGSSFAKSFQFDRLDVFKKPIPQRRCIYPNCSRKTVKRSHTIQRSGPLKTISENGIVVGPTRDWKTRQMKMAKIGLNQASTFPGYCEKHEKLFKSFELTGEFAKEVDVSLQLYRTVCREVVETEHYIDVVKNSVPKYKSYRNRKLAKHSLERLSLQENAKYNELHLTKIIEELASNAELDSVNRDLQEKEDFLFNDFIPIQQGLFEDISLGHYRNTIVKCIKFGDQLPVTLATIDRINFPPEISTDPLIVIFNVLPKKKFTYIFIAARKDQEQLLNIYSESLYSSINCLNRIESLVLSNFDKWFIGLLCGRT